MSIQKKKRLSKRNKSAWRKTDIQDVEDFLEKQRQDERIGSFADKPDVELFHIDGSANKQRSLLSEKQKRLLNAKKPLKSLQIFVNTSSVQDPIAKRNILKQKKSGRNIEQEVCNPTKPLHFKANEDRMKAYAKFEEKVKQRAAKLPDTNKNVWAKKDFRDSIPGLKDKEGWISKQISLHVTANLGKPIVKTRGSIKLPTSRLNKVEMPHAGSSYNPSLEDHQNLLSKAVEKEEKIIKEEKHLKRVTTDMFCKVTPEERDRQRFKEICLEDEDDNEQSVIEQNKTDEGDNEPYYTINSRVENKKKSKQARNKERRQKELQRKCLEKKALKQHIADLNRLKSLQAEVAAEAEQMTELRKKRKAAAKEMAFQTKRLGRNRFVEADEDLNMPEDLAGNLRNVKTESSLLLDRFKSLQKRNVLPVSTGSSSRKRPKLKRFTRTTHKKPGITFQMLRERKQNQTANNNFNIHL